MGINTFLIAQICSYLTGEWCPKTTEAASRYSGVYYGINAVEGRTTQYAKETVGKDGERIMIIPFTVANFVRTKEAKFHFKSRFIGDRVELRGSKQAGAVGITWGF